MSDGEELSTRYKKINFRKRAPKIAAATYYSCDGCDRPICTWHFHHRSKGIDFCAVCFEALGASAELMDTNGNQLSLEQSDFYFLGKVPEIDWSRQKMPKYKLNALLEDERDPSSARAQKRRLNHGSEVVTAVNEVTPTTDVAIVEEETRSASPAATLIRSLKGLPIPSDSQKALSTTQPKSQPKKKAKATKKSNAPVVKKKGSLSTHVDTVKKASSPTAKRGTRKISGNNKQKQKNISEDDEETTDEDDDDDQPIVVSQRLQSTSSSFGVPALDVLNESKTKAPSKLPTDEDNEGTTTGTPTTTTTQKEPKLKVANNSPERYEDRKTEEPQPQIKEQNNGRNKQVEKEPTEAAPTHSKIDARKRSRSDGKKAKSKSSKKREGPVHEDADEEILLDVSPQKQQGGSKKKAEEAEEDELGGGGQAFEVTTGAGMEEEMGANNNNSREGREDTDEDAEEEEEVLAEKAESLQKTKARRGLGAVTVRVGRSALADASASGRAKSALSPTTFEDTYEFWRNSPVMEFFRNLKLSFAPHPSTSDVTAPQSLVCRLPETQEEATILEDTVHFSQGVYFGHAKCGVQVHVVKIVPTLGDDGLWLSVLVEDQNGFRLSLWHANGRLNEDNEDEVSLRKGCLADAPRLRMEVKLGPSSNLIANMEWLPVPILPRTSSARKDGSSDGEEESANNDRVSNNKDEAADCLGVCSFLRGPMIITSMIPHPPEIGMPSKRTIVAEVSGVQLLKRTKEEAPVDLRWVTTGRSVQDTCLFVLFKCSTVAVFRPDPNIRSGKLSLHEVARVPPQGDTVIPSVLRYPPFAVGSVVSSSGNHYQVFGAVGCGNFLTIVVSPSFHVSVYMDMLKNITSINTAADRGLVFCSMADRSIRSVRLSGEGQTYATANNTVVTAIHDFRSSIMVCGIRGHCIQLRHKGSKNVLVPVLHMARVSKDEEKQKPTHGDDQSELTRKRPLVLKRDFSPSLAVPGGDGPPPLPDGGAWSLPRYTFHPLRGSKQQHMTVTYYSDGVIVLFEAFSNIK